MKKSVFDNIIEDKMREMGFIDYKIVGCKLNEQNMSVAPDGVLEYDKVIDVVVQPISKLEKINITIKLE